MSYCFSLPRCWEGPQLSCPNSHVALPRELSGGVSSEERLRKLKWGALIQSRENKTKQQGEMEMAKCSEGFFGEARNSPFPSPKV